MKSTIYSLLLSATIFLLPSCDVTGQHRVKGSGNVTKQERNVGPFKGVDVRGSMDVYLTQGPAKAAVIEAEDNIIPYIELEVEEDGELVVRIKRGVNVNTTRDMKVYLTTPDLESIDLAGSGDIKLENKFSNKDGIRVGLSGSGDIEGALNAPKIKASIAGSGDIALNGETKELNVSIAGSGDFKGKQLMSENAQVTIAGSGNADVHASVKLDVKIAGSGDVHYSGSPQIASSVVGSGTVARAN